MTLCQNCNNNATDIDLSDVSLSPDELGKIVQYIIKLAANEGRLICCVDNCAEYLEVDPQGVFACLFSIDNGVEDVSFNIYKVLIEAFCNENGIAMLKVENSARLFNLLRGCKFAINGQVGLIEKVQDVYCVVIQKTWKAVCKQEQILQDQFNSLGNRLLSVVVLPET